MSTTRYTIQSSAWTTIATGSGQDVLVQLMSGPVLVYHGGSSPTENPPIGIKMTHGDITHLTFTALLTGQNVYCRSIIEGGQVVVMEQAAE